MLARLADLGVPDYMQTAGFKGQGTSGSHGVSHWTALR